MWNRLPQVCSRLRPPRLFKRSKSTGPTSTQAIAVSTLHKRCGSAAVGLHANAWRSPSRRLAPLKLIPSTMDLLAGY